MFVVCRAGHGYDVMRQGVLFLFCRDSAWEGGNSGFCFVLFSSPVLWLHDRIQRANKVSTAGPTLLESLTLDCLDDMTLSVFGLVCLCLWTCAFRRFCFEGCVRYFGLIIMGATARSLHATFFCPFGPHLGPRTCDKRMEFEEGRTRMVRLPRLDMECGRKGLWYAEDAAMIF